MATTSTQNSYVQLVAGLKYLLTGALSGLVAPSAIHDGWPEARNIAALSADGARTPGAGQNPQVFIWLGDAAPDKGNPTQRTSQGPARADGTIVTLRGVGNWTCPCRFVLLTAGESAKTLAGLTRSKLIAALGTQTLVRLPDDQETAGSTWTPAAATFALTANLSATKAVQSQMGQRVREIMRIDVPYLLAYSEYATEVDTIIQAVVVTAEIGVDVVPTPIIPTPLP